MAEKLIAFEETIERVTLSLTELNRRVKVGRFPRKVTPECNRVAFVTGEGEAGSEAHNMRSKEEVDALIEQAVAAGATLQKKAHEADWGGYSGYFADPDGFLWEVAWNPHITIE